MVKYLKGLAAAAALMVVVQPVFAANTVLGVIPKSLNGSGGGKAVISCKEGKKFLQSKGYSVTLALDCRPRFFIYSAVRQGVNYVVTVDGRYPRIVDASKD